MARVGRNASLDELVQDAIAPVVARLSGAIAKHVAKLTVDQLEAALARKPSRHGRTAVARQTRSRRVELKKWVAGNRARRVPNFVIELTGLDTKKQIVAKYGENAAFAKGKPLPPDAKTAEPKREVKAKGPTIRRNGKAAA